MEKANAYPLVTVVIPTFNRAVLIQKAISSVLSQTYSHLELVIADDGSTDNTAEIVHAIKDNRVIYRHFSHTGHIGKVRNAGAAAGNGAWIAFLDSDDAWQPGKIEAQIALINETGKRWCYTGFVHVDEQGNTIPPKAGAYRPLSGNITGALLKHKATVVVCTLLVERKLFEEAGGFSTDERLELRGDYELALRLSLLAEAVAAPGLLVRVLEHPGRITSTIMNPHERSAMPYRIFLEYARKPLLRKIASNRIDQLLAEAASHRSARGNNNRSIHHPGDSTVNDRSPQTLSVLRRVLRAALGRKKYSSANEKT